MAITQILSKANRQAGTYSASHKVPTLTLSDSSRVIVQVNSDIPELQDETRTIDFGVYISDDGLTWRSKCGFSYRGYLETWKMDQPQPGVILNPSEFSNKWLKVEFTINKAWKIGLQVTII